jgi:GT2 family glycosyltransferase
MSKPDVTYILATHNRRDVLLETLHELAQLDRHRIAAETIVVDNASTDGTPDAVHAAYPDVRLIALSRNKGSCAKALAVEQAAADHIVFLDDDSYPLGGSIPRMLKSFSENPRLAAAGFRVHLPDHREECSALPGVFVGCGVGLRADALRDVGGLDLGFFMQAEEYDLAFRLVAAGWRVGVFDDLHVRHQKAPQSRVHRRTLYYDTRNNLTLARRYLPDDLCREYVRDWSERYYLLARRHGHVGAWRRARASAWLQSRSQRRRFECHRLTPDGVDDFFQLAPIRRRFQRLKEDGVRRVVLADLGKNIYAFHAAAQRTGVSVLAIADDLFSSLAPDHRGVPLITTSEITGLRPDAVVVSNTSYVHAASACRRLKSVPGIPVHAWFTTPCSGPAADFASDSVVQPADTALTNETSNTATLGV